ncbi:unnamed protein product [Pylaiella littoralis]
MDLLLSTVTPIVLRRGSVAAHGMTITADGYTPRGGGGQTTRSKNDFSDSSNSNDTRVGPVLVDTAVRLALFAGCLYTSVRFTQYLSEAKKRENQAKEALLYRLEGDIVDQHCGSSNRRPYSCSLRPPPVFASCKSAVRVYLKAKLPARDDINIDSLDFNAHEIAVAQDVVASCDLDTTFDMIGGLGDLREEIMDIVTLACSREAYLQGVCAPKGILLSGVPGTGKTMLARAIAKESGATFINVRMGAVQQKWVGEGEKMVAAIFSLAHKLAPSIIFLDEIDSFMRNRNMMEQDHVSRVKTEFMTLWDGLLTERSRPVIVLGTTNRPLEIDPAILRRLPRQFVVGLPHTAEQRENILELIARKYTLEGGVDLAWVAVQTAGFSGSDLDALFQAAQTVPAREFARSLREDARVRADLAAAAAEDERAARRLANAAENASSRTPDGTPAGAGGAGGGSGDAARALTILRGFLDASRRSVSETRNMRRVTAALTQAHRRLDDILRPVVGSTQQPLADGVAREARSSPALRMRGISMEDFATALENVRPTGEMAADFAAAGGAQAVDRAGRRRAQEQ